jgi:hypothetical protein
VHCEPHRSLLLRRRRSEPPHRADQVTVDGRRQTPTSPPPLTPTYSRSWRSSPTHQTSTPPPPPLLNVDECHHRAEAAVSTSTRRYGGLPPSYSYLARHPIDACSCATRVGEPPRASHRRSPHRHTCTTRGECPRSLCRASWCGPCRPFQPLGQTRSAGPQAALSPVMFPFF